MRNRTAKPNEYAAREKRNSLYAVFWAFAYGISLALSTAVLAHFPEPKLVPGIFALFITVGFGIAAFVAHVRLLQGLDERQRKIWFESLAITFGVLWIAFGCLITLDKAGINHIDSVEIGLLSVLAGLGFASGAIRTIR